MTNPHAKPTNPKDIVGIRKTPFSVIPWTVLSEVGVGMLEGACKYGRHNYREMGVRASVYFDATMRHLVSWWEGEDIDTDSGLSHITKAICSLVVLRDAMIQNKFEDDRAPSSIPFFNDLNAKAAAIIDKYADRKPYHYTIKDGPVVYKSGPISALGELTTRADDLMIDIDLLKGYAGDGQQKVYVTNRTIAALVGCSTIEQVKITLGIQ